MKYPTLALFSWAVLALTAVLLAPGCSGLVGGSTRDHDDTGFSNQPDAGPDARPPEDAGSVCEMGVTNWVAADGGFWVRHQHGQTFVGWADNATSAAGANFRYRLYRSNSPITDLTWASAELVATKILNNSAVMFGYGFNAAARLSVAAPMTAFAPDAGPLPRWSGLWATTPTHNGCSYYAIVATDAADQPVEPLNISARSTLRPVSESVAPREPLLVIDSRDRGIYWPNTFTTGTPDLPLWVQLHGSTGQGGPADDYGDGYVYFSARDEGYQEGLPGTFCVREAHSGTHQLTLHGRDALVNDEGTSGFETYWFGAVATPRWAMHTEPRAYPFTERRHRWVIDWVTNHYRVNRNKVYCGGGSMGAWGSTSFCLHQPGLFAAIYPDRPRTIQRAVPQWPRASAVSQPLMLDDGVTPALERLDSVAFAASHHEDLAFYGFDIGRLDGYADWADQPAMVRALTSAHHGFAFAWNNGDHAGAGPAQAQIMRYYPPEKFDLRWSYPAFGHSSLDQNMGNGDPANGDLEGGVNLGFDWKDVVDLPKQWSATINNALTTNGSAAADVTPRRVSHFVISPMTVVHWANSEGGEGQVAADAWGLVTVPQVRLPADGGWTTLTLQVD